MTAIYTCLGFVSEIKYTDKKGDAYILEFKAKQTWNTQTGKDSFVMVASGQREILIVLWNKPKATKMPARAGKAKELYSDWTDYESQVAYKINVPKAKAPLIGYITRIEYTSDKFEQSGDGPGHFHLYRHKFKAKQKLYANKGNTIFKIRSNTTLLNYRGIIG